MAQPGKGWHRQPQTPGIPGLAGNCPPLQDPSGHTPWLFVLFPSVVPQVTLHPRPRVPGWPPQDNSTRPNATSPSLCQICMCCADNSAICTMRLMGNTAIIHVILRAPSMKTVTNMFLLNLAVANGLFTLVLHVNIAEHLLQR